MNQLFTLTTDFGTRDGYVGAVKGRLLSLCPGAMVVDITHEIDPQEIFAATWSVQRASAQFPPGTIHLVVVDPGVGSDRHALLVGAAQQWYLAPDNGVLTSILHAEPEARVFALRQESKWWQAHTSFDGLALFAPAAACVANGIELKELGEPFDSPVMIDLPQAKLDGDQLTGQILMFDRFGNAQTNISREMIDECGFSRIHCAGVSFELASHYAAESEHPVALINSDGYLELAVFSGSARERFRLRTGETVTIHD